MSQAKGTRVTINAHEAIEIDAKLLDRARALAQRRNMTLELWVHTALQDAIEEHELYAAAADAADEEDGIPY